MRRLIRELNSGCIEERGNGVQVIYKREGSEELRWIKSGMNHHTLITTITSIDDSCMKHLKKERTSLYLIINNHQLYKIHTQYIVRIDNLQNLIK